MPKKYEQEKNEFDSKRKKTTPTSIASQPLIQGSLLRTTTIFCSYDRNDPRQKLITKEIGKMITRDLQPFTIVENKGFISLL